MFGKTRDVMWNAGLDIVSLGTPHISAFPRFYRELFRRQFPGEVRQVQDIAVPLTDWEEKPELGGLWAGYTELKMIVVVLGEATHENSRGVMGHDICGVVHDMESGLGKMTADRGMQWNVPSIELVPTEGDILRAGDLDMRVECVLCSSIDWRESFGGPNCKVVPMETQDV